MAAGILWLLVSASTWGLSVCDYRSPITSLTDARLLLGYRYYDNANTPGVDVNSGRFAADYNQLYDSPNVGFTIAGSGELTIDAFTPTGWLGQGTTTFRYYPFSESFVFGFGDLQASMASGQPSPGIEVRVGAGLGRFTDVTPLAKAMTISRQLVRLGALSNPLSDGTLSAVAALIGRQVEYETVKALVSDIEPVIESEAGVALDARALLTVEEIVLSSEGERRCGWSLQLGIGYELVDPFGNPQNVVVGGTADAAYAIGPDDQMLLHASYSGPFDLMDENTLTASWSYEYALSAKSTVAVDYALQRVKPSGQPAGTSHAANLSLGFDVGGVDILFQVSFSRGSADAGWSYDISISASMELL